MSDELVQRLRYAVKPGGFGPFGLIAEAVAEIERLRAEVAKWVEQHGRDSAELRSLCEARDEARRNVVELREDLQESRSALAALRKRVGDVRPLFKRYDKRLESPAAGFTGTIAVRVEDYDALRNLVVEVEG